MIVSKRWKILQIIAAQPGWKGVYCQESTTGQVKISNRAVICWALVEVIESGDSLQTEVRGVVQESNYLAIVDDSITTDNLAEEDMIGKQYFLGYNDPDAHKESDYWIEQASARLKAETHDGGTENQKAKLPGSLR